MTALYFKIRTPKANSKPNIHSREDHKAKPIMCSYKMDMDAEMGPMRNLRYYSPQSKH